jgi:hypothetical protein
VADPQFRNLAGGDYTPATGSPAIGTGAYIPGVSTANPPNIGAKWAIMKFLLTLFFSVFAYAALPASDALAGAADTGEISLWELYYYSYCHFPVLLKLLP